MKKGDIRGLSTVVATLLIILLVIVAVAIVWSVIRTVIVNNSQQISLGKLTVDLQIVKVSQDTQNDKVNIQVKRNPGEGEIEGLVFSIFDGKKTTIIEEHNVSINPLETKTFIVDYSGEIVSVSLYPIFLTSSGSTSTGNLADTFYYIYSGGSIGEEPVSPGCTPVCAGKTACEDNGCGGDCGLTCSGSTPYCIGGICKADTGGAQRDCSCAEDICVGTTCPDGIGGHCSGTIQPDCTDNSGNKIWCGQAQNTECSAIPNACGGCANGFCSNGFCCLEGETNYGGVCCPEGYHSIDGETCTADCNPIANCLGKECGSNGCGGFCNNDQDCTFSHGSNFHCNSTQLCEQCIPNCGARECGGVPNGCGDPLIGCGNCTALHDSSYFCNMTTYICQVCTPDCGQGRNCGDSLNSCGTCGTNNGECLGQDTCVDGFCTPPEGSINSGTILSVWPIPVGHNFIIGNNLPLYGEDHTELDKGNFVKIIGSYSRCYPILLIDYPINPGQFTVVKVSTGTTDIEIGNNYEIWETLAGCNG